MAMLCQAAKTRAARRARLMTDGSAAVGHVSKRARSIRAPEVRHGRSHRNGRPAIEAPLKPAKLIVAAFPSELGWMATVERDGTLLELTFGHGSPAAAMKALRTMPSVDSASIKDSTPLARRLQAYARGSLDDFRDVPISLDGLRSFHRRVIEQCRRIPFGQTRTYGQLAALAGSPGAARAVGNVMSSNLTPLVVPCHRVVACGGKLGHYSAAGGRRMKLRLLESEAAAAARRAHAASRAK